MSESVNQPTNQPTGQVQSDNAVGIKETLTSLIIAFMLAFLFRGFVIEGFQIPTGSMAPTLLGRHIRMTSPYNGYDWAIGPMTYQARSSVPTRVQTDIQVADPMSRLAVSGGSPKLASGDRVFVLKYLPILHQPERWDVVVFKNPGSYENYIKRLVGLPGEQVAFVDGDVFSRDFVEGKTARAGWASWSDSDWHVNRKPERIQREMFQDVFNSRYVPEGELTYRSPMSATTDGWTGVEDQSRYVYAGTGDTALVWNGSRAITDANAYNALLQRRLGYTQFSQSDDMDLRVRPFPVSDIAIGFDIKADEEPVKISAILEARGMVFRGVIDSANGRAFVEMRQGDSAEGDEQWVRLDEGTFSAFGSDGFHQIEFWHVDQALWLFVDDKLVCGGMDKGGYTLSPAQRVVAATGRDIDQLEHASGVGDGVRNPGVLSKPEIYRKPRFRWAFSGGGFALTNVMVQRDIAYQVNRRQPTRGGHPDFFPTMTDEEYFMCGDNSANSGDSRLWSPDSIEPWIKAQIDDQPGMVHQDLVVGKAFVVYFPSMLEIGNKGGKMIAPDFGRVRWIW